jgi:hypothetical protein
VAAVFAHAPARARVPAQVVGVLVVLVLLGALVLVRDASLTAELAAQGITSA